MDFTTNRHDTYPYIEPTKFNLKGKYVLITGASKGVGRATAVSYAKAGASGIVLAARSSLDAVVREVKEAAASSGRPEPKVLALKLDVADRANVEAVAKEVAKVFDGRLDILVNNAGYLSAFHTILDSDPDDWWNHFEVNVKGVYLVTRAFLPLLFKSSLKVIINLTSIGAVWLSGAPASAYGTTKLAVMRLTEYLEQDYGVGKEGVLAIAVHPGGVKTELATNMPEDHHEYLIDTPELAGDTLVWLSAERREWLAGRYVSAAWDMEALSGRKEDILKGDLLKDRLAVNTFPSQ